MKHRFSMVLATLSTWSVGFLCGSDARAERDLAITDTFINDAGDLEISFTDVFPIPAMLRYDAQAKIELIYVCADTVRRPLRENRFRQIVRTVAERSVQFSTGFMGEVRGFVTLNYPRGQENLLCTPGTSPTLASVNYTEIQVRNQFGVSAGARNSAYVFIRLPTNRIEP